MNKFSYLKTLLTGKAKDALNSLERTSGNYDEAVAILKSRFGDPQVVIQSNIDKTRTYDKNIQSNAPYRYIV